MSALVPKADIGGAVVTCQKPTSPGQLASPWERSSAGARTRQFYVPSMEHRLANAVHYSGRNGGEWRMKTVMKILIAAAIVTGATAPAAAQPAAAAGFFFAVPSVPVIGGPRRYYRGERYIWGHYLHGYFQADPHWEGRYASAYCVRYDGLGDPVRRCR
jgi:hypothetical protein